eukprot:5281869-Pyramimonas_sp.AAC.1
MATARYNADVVRRHPRVSTATGHARAEHMGDGRASLAKPRGRVPRSWARDGSGQGQMICADR